MREHAGIGASLKEETLRLHLDQAWNVARAFGRERLRIANAAAESHDNDFALSI
jgi:hypothetical protein